VEWVRLENVPVASNRIALEHHGNAATEFTNQAGPSLTWKVAFPAPASGAAGIFVDGAAAPKLSFEHRANRQPVISAALPVKEGQRRMAKLVV